MYREQIESEIVGILEDRPSQDHVRLFMDLIERVRQEAWQEGWEEAYRSAEYEREDCTE